MNTIKELLEYAGNLSRECFSDGEKLMEYLRVMANFPNEYTVNNQLLIMGQNAAAKRINGMEEWSAMGVSVNPDAQPLLIIEPDGEGAFRTKYMYEINDTDCEAAPPVYDKATMLETMISVAGAKKMEVVDEIKAGVRAMYIPETDTIRIKRSCRAGFDRFFSAIAGELYHKNMAAGCEGTYRRAQNMFTSKCVAYALGERYGMDTSDISLSNLPEKFSEYDIKKCKNELNKIKLGFDCIVKEVEMKLDTISFKNVSQIVKCSMNEVPFNIYMFERVCYRCSKKTKIITYIRYADTDEDVSYPWNKNRLARGQRVLCHCVDPSIEYYDVNVIGDIDRYDEMLIRLYSDKIQMKYSKTIGRVYAMNLCEHCGAKQGNNFIYREVNKIIKQNRQIVILNKKNKSF